MQIVSPPGWLPEWLEISLGISAFIATLYSLWKFLIDKPFKDYKNEHEKERIELEEDLKTYRDARKTEFDKFKEDIREDSFEIRTSFATVQRDVMENNHEIEMLRESLKRIEEGLTELKQNDRRMLGKQHDMDTRLVRVEEKVTNIDKKMGH